MMKLFYHEKPDPERPTHIARVCSTLGLSTKDAVKVLDAMKFVYEDGFEMGTESVQRAVRTALGLDED